MPTHVAFLRGINVGGHHKVPMASLRTLLAGLGLGEPGTLLASGNAWFDADSSEPEAELAGRISDAIEDRFGFAVPVMIRPTAELLAVARAHPFTGACVDPRFLHVLFLEQNPEPGAVPDPHEIEPDQVHLDGRHLYVHYVHGAARSKLTVDRVKRWLGVDATGRNWNTVQKVAARVR